MTPPTITQEVSTLTGTGCIRQHSGPGTLPSHHAAASVAAGDVLGALAIGTAVAALWLRRLRYGLAAAQVTGR